MTADQTREALAAALREKMSGLMWGRLNARELADALLPTVQRLIAAELRALAHRLDDGGDETIEIALGGAAYVHRVLCDRAAELDPS